MIELTRRELRDLLIQFLDDNEKYTLESEDQEWVVQEWMENNEDLIAQFDSDEQTNPDDE